MAKVVKKFKAKGMHCKSCEALIEKSVRGINGVEDLKINYENEKGEVVFDDEKTNIEEIFKAIEENGYNPSLLEEKENNEYYNFNKKFFGIAFGVIGILVLGYYIFNFVGGIKLPEISQNMSYGLLFLVGLLTGFHCVSMCGGFVVSYTAKDVKEGRKSHKSHLMYGIGKVVSYTLIGATFGLLGSIITFTPTMRGIAGIIAGIFLIIFGLNMLNLIPFLRKMTITTPAFLSKFVNKESEKNNSSLVIGLLNGLMIACGPLQAIYIMAAGTGSLVEGAKLLLVFALGTLPVMLSFGFLTSFISSKATHKILKASGVVVILLGLIMINRGLALTGTGFDTNSLLSSVSAKGESITGNAIALEQGYQIIRMDITYRGWEPNKFVLKKGVPVKWIINGKEISGCNNAIQVPKLNLKFDIRLGEQTIEFTPTEEGVIPWSCWMGMIRGTFVVKEDIDLANIAQIQKELNAVPLQKGGSCGGSGGGCGCGG